MKRKIILALALSLSLSGCSAINLGKEIFSEIKEDVSARKNKGEIQDNTEAETYDRQERIDAYQEENPNLDYEECVKRVYMNLDVEPYTQTVDVQDLDDITMLVNKYSGLPFDYVPEDLVVVYGGEQVRATTAEAFNGLIEECRQFGLDVSSWSGFRSYETQEYLFNNGVANYGLDYAEQYWTHPGFSEHQTGMAIDVCLDGDRSDLDAARNNPHYEEFLKVLHKYGFILRYADDKTQYTLIAPESWHIRYVGEDLATFLYENDYCLDEYYGLVDAGLIQVVQ